MCTQTDFEKVTIATQCTPVAFNKNATVDPEEDESIISDETDEIEDNDNEDPLWEPESEMR